LRARYLEFRAGRFYGRDPEQRVFSLPERLNAYTYAMDNPVSGVDPSGKSFLSVIISVSEVLDSILFWAERAYSVAGELSTGYYTLDVLNSAILPAYELEAASFSSLADGSVPEDVFYRSYELAAVALRIGYSTASLWAWLPLLSPDNWVVDYSAGFAFKVLSQKANDLAMELRASKLSPQPFLLIGALGRAAMKWGEFST
jgi:hypothetical protein